MTASEFAFLAMGLILGVAAGAALVEFIRARPPSPREVRLTVAPDAVPRRRASTLSNDAFTESLVADAPALGGPADRLDVVPDDGSSWFAPRTPVLEPRPGTVASSPFRLAEPPGTTVVTAQGVPVSSGVDPMLTALRASAAASAQAAMASGISRSAADTDEIMAAAAALVGAAATVVTSADDDAPKAIASGPKGQGTKTTKGGSAKTAAASIAPAAPTAPTGDPDGSPADAPTGPCGEARRLADERCELATRARAQATEAEEAHRAAQRTYDDHEVEMAAATAAEDPRADPASEGRSAGAVPGRPVGRSQSGADRRRGP